MAFSITNYLKALGYRAHEEGICYGLSSMAVQAALLNDLELFISRLEFIKQFQPRQLAQAVTNAERRQAERVVDTKLKTLSEGMDNLEKMSLDEKIKQIRAQEKNLGEPEDIQTKIRRNIEEMTLSLPIEEQQLLSIKPFFDSVELYFQGEVEAYKHLFPEGEQPERQDIEQISHLVAPESLTRSATTQSNISSSQPTRESGITKDYAFTGSYSKEKLINYFKNLNQALNHPDISQPITFQLISLDHAITVIYNPQKKKNRWLVVDPSNLSLGYIKDPAMVAHAIANGFNGLGSSNPYTTFSTNVFLSLHLTTETKNHMDTILSSGWFKKSHTVSHHSDNNRWLQVAVLSHDTKSLELLLKHGTNPNFDSGKSLGYAIEGHNIESVKILLKYGADPNLKIGFGPFKLLSLEQIASFKGNEQIVGLIKTANNFLRPMREKIYKIKEQPSLGSNRAEALAFLKHLATETDIETTAIRHLKQQTDIFLKLDEIARRNETGAKPSFFSGFFSKPAAPEKNIDKAAIENAYKKFAAGSGVAALQELNLSLSPQQTAGQSTSGSSFPISRKG